jgi:glutamate carboxypeptidase
MNICPQKAHGEGPDEAAATLAFDTNAMLGRLRRWVECESPTYDAAAVESMLDLVARDLAMLGARCERIPGDGHFAGCLKATWAHPRAGEPGILVVGHLDTVHPRGTLERMPWRIEQGRAYGPGILDMKSGNLLAVEAAAAVASAVLETPLPVTMLFTSDEEVGSPSCRAVVEAEASRAKYVLVPEPARRDGGVVTGRYAVARFRMVTRGIPSHAGLRPEEGVSAIREMAHQLLAVEALTDDDASFTVGVIHGGKWVNCVATECAAEILVSSRSDVGLDSAIARLRDLRPVDDRVAIAIEPTISRPAWTDAGPSHLYDVARAIAGRLGFDLARQSSSGGSDGNFTGAMGVPTLDGLGARGDGPHTLGEYIEIDSLEERARLFAGLLLSLR